MKEARVFLKRIDRTDDQESSTQHTEEAKSMVRPTKLRQANPVILQQLWKAVLAIRAQRQIPNIGRVTRFMQRENAVCPEDTELQLHYGVKDGLLNSYTAVGFKGSRVGIEQEGYKLPDEEDFDKGEYDWYCFNCHRGGEVLSCFICWRVFHAVCTQEDWSGNKFICSVCKVSRKKIHIKKKKLNRLLAFTVKRLSEKSRELHRIHMEERCSMLVYMDMDLNTMDRNCRELVYKCPEEFHTDAKNILHNVILCYGEYHNMADLARVMVKDCIYDIEEMKRCANCYYMSNARPSNWFAQPCNPTHELVYARVKGFCYWPSKVIREINDNYDVRFFGSPHERATVPENCIKPINTDINTLGIKRTAAFKKSMDELKEYQRLLSEGLKQISADHSSEDESIPESRPLSQDNKKTKKKEKGKEFLKEIVKKVFKTKDKCVKGRKRKWEEDEPPKKKLKEHIEEWECDRNSSMEEEEMMELDEECDDLDSSMVSSSHVEPPVLTKIQTSSKEDGDLVSSSSVIDRLHTSPKVHGETATVSTQVSRKIMLSGLITTASQTDFQVTQDLPKDTVPIVQSTSETASCTCADKFDIEVQRLKSALKSEHESSMRKALTEQEETLKREFTKDKTDAISRVVELKKKDIEDAKNEKEVELKAYFSEEMKLMTEKHNTAVSEKKKKQWCFNCEQEAMYHCCWNTSYCSIKCQQDHWHKEHKRVCRRKR